MAPEVIEPGKFTNEMRSGPHTDVFALGVTVFLIFAGFHRPYKPDIPGHAISKEVRLSVVCTHIGFAKRLSGQTYFALRFLAIAIDSPA